MPDVWLGRINRGIEKLFNIKGGPTVVDVAHTVQTTYSMPLGVEDRYLIGWNRFVSFPTILAAAAINGGSRLRNPAGSNAIAVIERIHVQTNGATNSSFAMTFGPVGTDLATSGTGVNLDTRGNPNSVIVSSVQNNASPAALANAFALPVAQNTGTITPIIATIDQEITLLPGIAIQAVDQTVNETFSIQWIWRERALETSELT